MKRICKLILLLLPFLLLCSCGKDGGDPGDKYRCETFSDGAYRLCHNETVVFPYRNRIYAGGLDAPLGYYEPDMTYTEISDHHAAALCVDESGIVLYDGGTIRTIDGDGNEKEWPVPAESDISAMAAKISRSGDNILLSLNDSSLMLSDTRVVFYAIDCRSGAAAVCDPEEVCRLFAVLNITPEPGGDFSVVGQYANALGEIRQAVLRYDGKASKLSFEQELPPYNVCDMVKGVVYGLEQLKASFFRLVSAAGADEDVSILRTVGTEKHEAMLSEISGGEEVPVRFDSLFAVGSSVLLWDPSSGILSVYGIGGSDTGVLTVLYPVRDPVQNLTGGEEINEPHVGKVEYAIGQFEEREDCVVEALTYPNSEFHDRLRTKLLSGDSDFDVVYLDQCTGGDLLAAILRYSLYLPLENSPEIMRNMERYADGVEEFMTVDGHLIGCPIQFGGMGYLFGAEWNQIGLTMPSSNWTLDDFWALCEEAKPYCGDGLALAPRPQLWILTAVMQNCVEKGSCDREEILQIMTRLQAYHQDGVIANYGEARGWLIRDVDIPPQSWYSFDAGVKNAAVLPLPSVNGRRYAPLESFVMGNARTKNPEMAERFLAMLTGEDFAPLIEDRKTYAMKDSTSYFTVSIQTRWCVFMLF